LLFSLISIIDLQQSTTYRTAIWRINLQ